MKTMPKMNTTTWLKIALTLKKTKIKRPPQRWRLQNASALVGEVRGALKTIQKFGHMSKLGLPYLPGTQVWRKISLDNYSNVYPNNW